MYGNLFVNTQISTNLRNKLQEYTQSLDKITQKYERIHSFTKRTVRSFRKFEVRVVLCLVSNIGVTEGGDHLCASLSYSHISPALSLEVGDESKIRKYGHV